MIKIYSYYDNGKLIYHGQKGNIKRIICFIKGICKSATHLSVISGHDYVEKYNDKHVQILECELCKHTSIGFKGE